MSEPSPRKRGKHSSKSSHHSKTPRPKPLKPEKSIPAGQPAPETAAVDAPVLNLKPISPGESFVIPEQLVGKTIVAVLRLLRPGESWSKLTEQVRRAYVSINGVACIDEVRRVALGDVLELGEKPHSQPPKASDVKIVYVDPHVVVVEKPSGMLTHRRIEERNWSDERKARQPTLDEALNDLLARRAVPGARTRSRAGMVRCVHRLDRDTSGLLVFARNDEAEAHLVSQFRKHTVHRVYWAIVHGRPADGTIVSNIARDRGDGRRGSVLNPKVGQRAVTHVRCLEQYGNYSLVECRLETGRTNQIRIHMAEAGHLVCGDPKYAQPYLEAMVRDSSKAPRLALHAAELGFIHPVTGEELFFQMAFPPDLELFARNL